MKAFCQIYAQFDQVGARIEEESKRLLDLGLVCDTTFQLKQAARSRGALERIRGAGGLCALNLYPADCDPSCVDPNWWKYSESECRRLLERAQKAIAPFDLGPMEAVNTYTPGNPFVQACRQLDIRYILGFCAPIVIEDGAWEIAHYASPLSPYFISSEDFRKPLHPGAGNNEVMMASMELRNPLVCQNHWSEGPWCPLNAQAADRWLEPTADPLPFLQIAEDWIRQSEMSDRPLFFTINLQYFFAGRCYEHNRRALEWLAEQRDKGRLEVGSLKTWADRLKVGENSASRQTTYWRGEMMGFHVGHRPGCFPDVVVDENPDAQVIFQRPEPLPQSFYDYTKTWDYPAFEPDGSAPASESCTGIHVDIQTGALAETARSIQVTIDGGASLPTRPVKVMVWEACEGLEGPFTIDSVTDGWSARVVPHPCGIGAALLVEGSPSSEAASRVTLCVSARAVADRVLHRTWNDLVAAQTFYRNGRPYTVLAAQTPEPFMISAKLSRDAHDVEPLWVESLVGVDYDRRESTSGEVALRFDGTRLACWHRIWGVTAGQIELQGVGEVEARLRTTTAEKIRTLGLHIEPSAPGYQTFGNLRDTSRWDRAVARAAAEVEIDRMNQRLHALRPDCGDILIEAHPGIMIPRGSITKVLGHEFDRITCAEGYGFHELCADYPQGWDWGVAGWVQWRQLRLKIDGLESGGEPYLLHLLAFDPEGRDIACRVHFFDTHKAHAESSGGISIHQTAELCVVNEWILPKGVEGRWQESALCSIRIPDECLRWSSLGIWIVPLEKKSLYDWVAERGAPGMISHLWLSR